MFDARDLLGRIMQSGMTNKTDERLGHAMGPKGLAGGDGSLAQVFKDLMAQNRGGLGGIAGTAEKWIGTAGRQIQSGNPAALGGLAVLAGTLLSGRKGAYKGAAGAGLLALLGSLAFSALKSRSAGATAPSLEDAAAEPRIGLRDPQTPEEEAEVQDTAKLAVKAMINAAKADGEIDGSEVSRILGAIKENGGNEEEQAFVISEMQKPLDVDALVREVKSPEVAAQVYAASLLAISVDTDAERDYLKTLASRLNLDPAAIAKIHEAMDVSA
ncbi:MAG: tellurite resistance TerB family protein [Rhodospirillales bacterium]|nr:tellurite resistance TerB family protein [Rhodospirillales bacterium]